MKWTKIKTDLALATSGELFQKLVNYVVLMLLTRYLTPATMGQFFFAATLSSFFAMMSSLGTGRYLARAVAQEPDNALVHLGDVLSLRLPIVAAALVLLNATLPLLQPEISGIVFLTSVYVLVGDLYYSFGAFFTGMRRMGLRIVTGAIGPLLLAVLIVLGVRRDVTLHTLLGFYIIANFALVASAYLAVRLFFGPITIRFRAGAARRILADSWPLFLLMLLGVLQFKIDTVMIWLLASSAAVAEYETAYKLLEASRLIVRPASMVYFPVCAALAASADWTALRSFFNRLSLAAGILGGAVAAVVLAVADHLMPLIWGPQYASSGATLQVLFLSTPAVFVGFVAVFTTSAMHLERTAVRVMVGCLAVNVLLNCVAIPGWGAIGAAWTTLASETFLATLLIGVIYRRLHRVPASPN